MQLLHCSVRIPLSHQIILHNTIYLEMRSFCTGWSKSLQVSQRTFLKKPCMHICLGFLFLQDISVLLHFSYSQWLISSILCIRRVWKRGRIWFKLICWNLLWKIYFGLSKLMKDLEEILSNHFAGWKIALWVEWLKVKHSVLAIYIPVIFH